MSSRLSSTEYFDRFRTTLIGPALPPAVVKSRTVRADAIKKAKRYTARANKWFARYNVFLNSDLPNAAEQGSECYAWAIHNKNEATRWDYIAKNN